MYICIIYLYIYMDLFIYTCIYLSIYTEWHNAAVAMCIQSEYIHMYLIIYNHANCCHFSYTYFLNIYMYIYIFTYTYSRAQCCHFSTLTSICCISAARELPTSVITYTYIRIYTHVYIHIQSGTLLPCFDSDTNILYSTAREIQTSVKHPLNIR